MLTMGIAWGRRALAALLLVSCGFAAPPLVAGEWHFDVAADGVGVGTHVIAVQEDGETRTVTSEMSFGKLGITAYRQHEEESWKGDCLTRIVSRTEEHGRVTTVAGRQQGNIFHIDGPTPQQLRGCVMSFAYWNPRLLKQSHLVNVQTGAWTPVRIRDLGTETIDVGGKSMQATHHAIETEKNVIEVWYTPEGEWVSLKTTTRSGGHVLTYSLRSRPK
jgi:uncharacterized protein DUF6134